jgi:proteasome lid subunit RPN8/RPN11
MESAIELTPTAYDALVSEALGAHPAECCGLLAGASGRVERVYPVPNAAVARSTRYEMAPPELWAARGRARRDGFEVVGFYHSHPRTSPVPSSYDVERAYYPEAIYVIVGVEPRPSVRAYRIADGRVDEVAVKIGTVEAP